MHAYTTSQCTNKGQATFIPAHLSADVMHNCMCLYNAALGEATPQPAVQTGATSEKLQSKSNEMYSDRDSLVEQNNVNNPSYQFCLHWCQHTTMLETRQS